MQVAGINSFSSTLSYECMSVNNPPIDEIVSKIMQKFSMDNENEDGGQLTSLSQLCWALGLGDTEIEAITTAKASKSEGTTIGAHQMSTQFNKSDTGTPM